MSDVCLICRRWPTKEDHEGYRAYVTDDRLRYLGLPMTFSQWLGLEEVHFDHRDAAEALAMLLTFDQADLKGERVWLVPQSISARASAAPGEWVEAEMPTITTRMRRRQDKATGRTNLELAVIGFGVTTSEFLTYTNEIRDEIPFLALRDKVVHAMARALAEKQRSER